MARKCGNEFDKYLACGSGGDNIGIAASGDVICCNNRYCLMDYQHHPYLTFDNLFLILFRELKDCNSAECKSVNILITVILTVVSIWYTVNQ